MSTRCFYLLYYKPDPVVIKLEHNKHPRTNYENLVEPYGC